MMKAKWVVLMIVVLALFGIASCQLKKEPVNGYTENAASSQQEKKEEQAVPSDRRPMVMINGKLYWDMNCESSITARCGTMDGTITSSVEQTEVPKENDQSNFGVGYGYQYIDENTIEILINEKWMVFQYSEEEEPATHLD